MSHVAVMHRDKFATWGITHHGNFVTVASANPTVVLVKKIASKLDAVKRGVNMMSVGTKHGSTKPRNTPMNAINTDKTVASTASSATVAPAPNAFFTQFVSYLPDGRLDMKKAVKRFEEAFAAWNQSRSQIRPAIIEELRNWGRVGEGSLVTFVLHKLHIGLTEENKESIRAEIKALEEAGVIVYQTTEGGSRRGRNAGWLLVSRAVAATG